MFKLSETLFRMGDEVLEIIGRNQMRLLQVSTGDSRPDALVNLAKPPWRGWIAEE